MKHWATWLSILAALVACAGVVILYRGGWTVHQVIGIAIAAPALCLWMLARIQLRGSFAVTAQARQLVTHGLYSKIQNPVYVFGALLIAGLIVFADRPRFFLLFVLLIPVQWVRIRNERRALEAKFGAAYQEYRRSTWF